jgi:predicted dehydrogenase
MIRWGILSTARIAEKQLIPAIQTSRNGRVLAIASRDSAKAAKFANQNALPKFYGSYQALLDDPEIDAIYNPLPNDGHAPWTIAALRAGKHVLCEKPFAMNAAETQAMIDAAKTSGKYLLEAFMYRYHPQHARVKALMDEGRIGQPNAINAAFTYAMSWDITDNVRLKPELGGGGLWDVGCYCVSAIRLISSQEPESVAGFQTLGGQSQVDENFVGILRFGSGLLAHFDCGMRGAFRNTYEVIGDQGHLRVKNAFRPDDQPGLIEVSYNDKLETISVPAENQYTLMVEDFADAILNDHPPRFPAEDGLRNMRVLDALAQSAREGVAVRL